MAIVEVPPGRDDLRVPGQRRDRGEAGLLAQEGEQLELRVEPGLESPVRLQQHLLADDHRRVRLVGAERALGERSRCRRSRRARPRAARRGPRPAGRRGRPRPVRAAGVGCRVAAECRHDPSVRHRDQQRPPGAVSGFGDPQRAAGQRERVALGAPIVEPEARDRQDVRRALVEDERRLELDRFDAATLRPEPAGGGELLSIEIRRGPARPRRELGSAGALRS